MKSGKRSAGFKLLVDVTLSHLLLFVVPAVAILLVVFVLWQHKLQTARIDDLVQERSLLSQQLATVTAELEELRSGLFGVGQKVKSNQKELNALQEVIDAIAAEVNQLTEQQQKIEMFDPDSKLYSRAMKMVQLGASLDEIIAECELPRAEAELLFNLHVQQGR